MAIPFSQSMRSLQADRSLSSLAGLTIAIVLLMAWSAWFFWAPITRYASGTIVGTTRDGRVIAEFSSEAWEQIWQGQVARIRPQGAIAEQVGTVSAVVANILGPPADDHFRVSFTLHWDASQWNTISTTMQEDVLSGEVEVEVEYVSPATLVARATGQLADMPSVSFSPQR